MLQNFTILRPLMVLTLMLTSCVSSTSRVHPPARKSSESIASKGRVYVTGHVARPGTYSLPADRPVHIKQILGAAGYYREELGTSVSIVRTGTNGTNKLINVAFANDEDVGPVLVADDTILVRKLSHEKDDT